MLGSILGRDDKIILGNRLQDSESPEKLQIRWVRTPGVEFSIFWYYVNQSTTDPNRHILFNSLLKTSFSQSCLFRTLWFFWADRRPSSLSPPLSPNTYVRISRKSGATCSKKQSTQSQIKWRQCRHLIQRGFETLNDIQTHKIRINQLSPCWKPSSSHRGNIQIIFPRFDSTKLLSDLPQHSPAHQNFKQKRIMEL